MGFWDFFGLGNSDLDLSTDYLESMTPASVKENTSESSYNPYYDESELFDPKTYTPWYARTPDINNKSIFNEEQPYNPWYDNGELYNLYSSPTPGGIGFSSWTPRTTDQKTVDIYSTFAPGSDYDDFNEYDQFGTFFDTYEGPHRAQLDTYGRNGLHQMLASDDSDEANELIVDWYLSDPRIASRLFAYDDFQDIYKGYDWSSMSDKEKDAAQREAMNQIVRRMRDMYSWDSIDSAMGSISAGKGTADDYAYLNKYFNTSQGMQDWMDIYAKRKGSSLNREALSRDLTDNDYDQIGNNMSATFATNSRVLDLSPSWNKDWRDEDDYLNIMNNAYGDGYYGYYDEVNSTPDENGMYYSNENLTDFLENKDVDPGMWPVAYYRDYLAPDVAKEYSYGNKELQQRNETNMMKFKTSNGKKYGTRRYA